MNQTVKNELRTRFLAERRSLTAVDVAIRSQQISDLFFRQPFAAGHLAVHTFLPILRQNEVDTWPIVQRFWQQLPATQIAVSVTDIRSNTLNHYVLTPQTPLVANRWGIPEPADATLQPVSSNQIDLVLVPLLIFDRQGHRVGYGKGYYDRFLADCRPDCLKVGLSLFEPVEQIADVALTDIALNACLTPKTSWLFA